MTFIPSSVAANIKASGPAAGRRYFWLRECVDNIIRYMTLGCIFVVPFMVAFFSRKYAAALIATEIVSYYVGTLISEFDRWYNNNGDYLFGQGEEEAKYTQENPPETELSKILQRLHHFSWKYGCTPLDMYMYLDRDEIPFENLDWIEAVSLLNQLSLYIGKRFEDEEQKEK